MFLIFGIIAAFVFGMSFIYAFPLLLYFFEKIKGKTAYRQHNTCRSYQNAKKQSGIVKYKNNNLTYIIEDSPEFKIKKRPVVIVCPGGGYGYLSDREGEILALQYSISTSSAASFSSSAINASFQNMP